MFFDPVRSAHIGLKAFDWGVQKKIYIPFHFIPSRPFDASAQNFSFVTERNSPFANMVFREACRKAPDETSRLIAIGIALHTLADSWAHQGFSGRADAINDVESLHLFRDGSWMHLFLMNIYLDIMPKVGHAQAGFFPDASCFRWKYTRAATKQEIERDNPREFSNALQTIYRLLVTVKKTEAVPGLPWNEIQPHLQSLLADPETDLETRCDKWRDLYKIVFGDAKGYRYDALQWRREALGETGVEWDELKQSEFSRLAYVMTPGFYRSKWVKFHQAALRQRNFVLEHLL
jgi:hypothetical protein